MANAIIETIAPYIADIAIVALFIRVAGVIVNAGINAFTKGEIRF